MQATKLKLILNILGKIRLIKLTIILFILSNFNILHAKKSLKTSQTYFLTRPLYHNMPARQTLWTPIINQSGQEDHESLPNEISNCRTTYNKLASNLQIIALAQESLPDYDKNVAGYFLFNCKSQLSIKGDNAISNITERDVRAEWVGLPSNFEGFIAINPQEKQNGFLIEFNQKLRNFISHKFFKNVYINISIPVVWTHNNINLTGTSAAIAAFNSPYWAFAKIPQCKQESHGAAEVRTSIGTTLYNKNDFMVATESSLIIALKKYHCPEYLFTPIVGTNNKMGLATNLRFDLPLHEECADYKALMFFCIEGQYYLKDTQFRTLDLRHKPWSRYLLYQNQYSGQIVQGVNILTPKVIVNPYCFVELDAGVRFDYKLALGTLEFELGYNFWSNGREKVELDPNCCQKTDFLFQNFGISGDTPLTSASNSTINYQAPNDSTFTTLTPTDLDFTSGGSRGAEVNKAYGFLGFKTPTARLFAFFAGLGASIEVPDSNTAFKQWTAWFKLGADF